MSIFNLPCPHNDNKKFDNIKYFSKVYTDIDEL
jgi:hypothetical protein